MRGDTEPREFGCGYTLGLTNVSIVWPIRRHWMGFLLTTGRQRLFQMSRKSCAIRGAGVTVAALQVRHACERRRVEMGSAGDESLEGSKSDVRVASHGGGSGVESAPDAVNGGLSGRKNTRTISFACDDSTQTR